MPTSSDYSSVDVVPYSKDQLIDFIRHKTGWDHRAGVSNKRQLNYICNFLKNDDVNAKTLVIENEYIDRHYLEDYSEYYARCFSYHPRKCSRLHFFSSEFDLPELVEALSTNAVDFVDNTLKNNYIGFIVIRPIPNTFFARICLNLPIQSDTCRIIKKEINVSLIGIPLTVYTAPFLEQDKVVSACATSALWALYNSLPDLTIACSPSPSAITKSATHNDTTTRTFPTEGLSTSQVIHSLRNYGLEPSNLPCDATGDLRYLRESVYGFINNEMIPILLGGTVYEINNQQIAKKLGIHAVCLLGYRLNDTISNYNDNRSDIQTMRLRSHDIDKYYAHDDRYGPYVTIEANPKEFLDESGIPVKGLLINSKTQHSPELLAPDLALIGLYHKVRLPYLTIKQFCETFYKCMLIMHDNLNVFLNRAPTDKQDYYLNIKHYIEQAIKGTWDISLLTSSRIKEELISTPDFCTFNGAPQKTSILFQNLPRFIWRCRIDNPYKAIYTDILFDATEISQGKILLGYITYDFKAETMWRYITERDIDSKFAWESLPLNQAHLGIFLQFFREHKNRTDLNSMYGPLSLPRRILKRGETDSYDNISKRFDIRTLWRGDNELTKNTLSKLDIGKRYIWIIDGSGNLVLGEDIHNQNDFSFQGHPTLTNGGPARIGGELFYKSNQGWQINLKSRTYSGHIAEDEKELYLNNVRKYNFNDLVSIQVRNSCP